jgi:hypothetical protein
MAIYPVGPQYRDEDEPIHRPYKGVDEHIYRKMDEIIERLKRIETTVSHLVDRQIIQGVTIDRLLQIDGPYTIGPGVDPED